MWHFNIYFPPGNSGCLTRHSSHKNNATHSNVCSIILCLNSGMAASAWDFFLLLLYHMDTITQHKIKSLHWNWKLMLGESPLPHQGLEPMSVLHLAFQSDVLPTELSPPLQSKVTFKQT